MTSWGYCDLVYNWSGEQFVHSDISGTCRIEVSWSEFVVVAPTSEEMSGKGALAKNLSRLLLRDRFSLICIVELFLGQWFVILVFAGDAEFFRRLSGRDDVPTGVETVGQPRMRGAVVTRRLVSLVASFSLTSLKLSTVVVEVGI